MISFKHKGNLSKTMQFLRRSNETVHTTKLKKYGDEGLKALSAATPKDTGKTASSWYYEIQEKPDGINLTFYNSNIQNEIPIAIIIQYGHATRNGGWVRGRDYINPAIQPIFDKLANELWKEVTKP